MNGIERVLRNLNLSDVRLKFQFWVLRFFYRERKATKRETSQCHVEQLPAPLKVQVPV